MTTLRPVGDSEIAEGLQDRKASVVPFVFGVLGVAILHFIASFFVAFAAGTTSDPVYKIAAQILGFPLIQLQGPDDLSPIVGWLAWAALSLFWGFAICSLGRFRRGRAGLSDGDHGHN